jgi:hypothetical protein
VGPGSRVHLVNRMQPGGDLEHAWIMFDHVKRVKNWTTMACHLYDSAYCRVMTIAVCDMQSEDAAAQMVLWKNLNDIMARHGVPEPKFKGFMADSTQANWNAVRVIYGSSDDSIPMKDQERTCLFHWPNPLKSIRKPISVPTSNTNTDNSVGSTRMLLQLQNLRLDTLPFEHGGSPPGPHPRRGWANWSSSWHSGTSATANGVDSCSW